MIENLPSRPDLAASASRSAEGQEKRARWLFDQMARNIGGGAVNHLKAMYPAALAAVPKSAEISLTNHIRNDINWRMRPLLMAMIAMHREWEEERAGDDA
ncbi:hypothetical protein [Sphingomonas sp.]|uniref:hypothetical protein n=1 Tax=Sphingomonas sp. TaxID=28214 RepID=UPI00261AF991|nr:hypothetical protein [Sphingomonas sp.]MDF2495069.1 hypothetical protein [Sphingomonas sp.]